MTPDRPEPYRRGPDLLRLNLVATPRWLREHRRALARAARPDAVAAEIATEVLSRSLPGRELTFEELMRAQGVKPFNAEEYWRRTSDITDEEWASLRAALAEARER